MNIRVSSPPCLQTWQQERKRANDCGPGWENGQIPLSKMEHTFSCHVDVSSERADKLATMRYLTNKSSYSQTFYVLNILIWRTSQACTWGFYGCFYILRSNSFARYVHDRKKDSRELKWNIRSSLIRLRLRLKNSSHLQRRCYAWVEKVLYPSFSFPFPSPCLFTNGAQKALQRN